jgi:hypothetical protein
MSATTPHAPTASLGVGFKKISSALRNITGQNRDTEFNLLKARL